MNSSLAMVTLVSLSLVGSALVFAKPTMPSGIAASPAMISKAAIQACESHIKQNIPYSSGIFAETKAGTEQHGFTMVSGVIKWRTLNSEHGTFACIYQQAQGNIISAVIPEPPGNTGKPIQDKPEMLRSACIQSITLQIKSAHKVTPEFNPQTSKQRTANTVTLTGSGTFTEIRRASSEARSTPAKTFNYFCLLDNNAESVSRSWFVLD